MKILQVAAVADVSNLKFYTYMAETFVEGRVIQQVQEPGHVSLALEVAECPWQWGDRLRLLAGNNAVVAFYHGPMKAWSQYNSLFGKEAASMLSQDPGIDVYLESALTMGGRKVEGHSEWLRVRAASEVAAGLPLLQTPVAELVRLERDSASTLGLPPASKLRKNVIQAVVLASHTHGLVLNVDFPLLRKLKGASDAWYELTVADRTVPILARRGISPEREAEVWARPDTLLYDFEAHWAFPKLTVMCLRPMQMNWCGKFPEAADVTMPIAMVDNTVSIRVS